MYDQGNGRTDAPLYDVEADIARARADRHRMQTDKLERSDDEIRQAGGIPLSPRAQVLLEHFSRSQTEGRTAPPQHRERALSDAVSCTRSIIEYIGALEDVATQLFSDDPQDTPREAIGLAAASLEQLCTDMEAHYTSTGEEMPHESRLGVETWRIVANRLRILEQRIDRIPGQSSTSPLILPDVRR